MARILAYTSPARGHLFPLTPILDEMSRRGHHIALRTLASQVPLMRAHGFEAAPISAQVEAIEQNDWQAGNAPKALEHAVRCFCTRAVYDAPDLQQAIAIEHPDALIKVHEAMTKTAGASRVAEGFAAAGGPTAAADAIEARLLAANPSRVRR